MGVVSCCAVLMMACRAEPVRSSEAGAAPALTAPIIEAEVEPEVAPPDLGVSGPSTPQVCASVGIGMDLRALPHPLEAGDATFYTRGKTQEFRDLLPKEVSVTIYTLEEVAAFTAVLSMSEGSDVVGMCQEVAAEFVATVPGHPLAKKKHSGGSIPTPCAVVPCDTGE